MTVEPAAAPADGAPADGAQPGDELVETLWADRVGVNRFDGHNSSGAVVRMGLTAGPDVFTPTELLRIALAGCVGLTADHPLTRRLSPQVPVTVRVTGSKDPVQQRFSALHEELSVDLSGLEPAERERLIGVVHRAVDRHCIVSRTLEHSSAAYLTVRDAS